MPLPLDHTNACLLDVQKQALADKHPRAVAKSSCGGHTQTDAGNQHSSNPCQTRDFCIYTCAVLTDLRRARGLTHVHLSEVPSRTALFGAATGPDGESLSRESFPSTVL